MADLVLVADGSTPQDDYSFLPPGVRAWGFYVGGHTAHSWTAAEVAHLEAAGYPGWGIWTAVQGRAINTADAQADAAGMLAGLERLNRPKILPVIYDVEYSTWAAGPTMTQVAAARWVAIMKASGYPNALWYGPWASTAPWRARWNGARPLTLPPGVVGIQYDHALANDAYDISVFDPSLLLGDDPAMALDPTNPTDKALIDQVSQIWEWVRALDYGYGPDAGDRFTAQGEMFGRIRSIDGNTHATAIAVKAIGTGGQVDVTTLATQLATQLGPDLGRQLVQALATALDASTQAS